MDDDKVLSGMAGEDVGPAAAAVLKSAARA